MIHTPPKPNNNPIMACLGKRLPWNIVMMTSHSGKMAPIIAPSPLGIYFTPHVLSVLLNIKVRKLRTKITIHCFPFGHGCFLKLKNPMYNAPPINCRMAIICNAGTFVTASFEASHVVPHAKLTHASANSALFLLEVVCLL